MKRALAFALAAAVIIPFTARAQGTTTAKPDFTGTWTMDAAKSDPAPQGRGGRGGGGGTQTIKQTATELAVTTEGRQGPQTRTYKLDGSDSMNPGRGGAQVKSVAKWDGNSIVIETTQDFQGTSVTTKEVRKMDGANMVIETTGPGMGGGAPTTRKTVWTKS